MDTRRSIQSDVHDFLGRVRRQWWLVLLPCLVGVGGAAVFTRLQPEVYRSSVSVLVQPIGTTENPPEGQLSVDQLNLDTESRLVRSTAVAGAAGRILRVKTPAAELADQVTVDIPARSQVLVITYSAGAAAGAQAGARAFGRAYLQNRHDSAAAQITNQIAVINTKVQQLTAQVTQLSTQIASTNSQSATRAGLDSQRATTMVQINMLSAQVNQLATTPVEPGKVIQDAPLPTQRTSPDLGLNLMAGGGYGLLLGLALAIGREALDRRVRHASDLARRTGVPVLAVVPRDLRPPDDEVVAPAGPGGRIISRLRNEVRASLAPAGHGGGRVVLVTGASSGPGATLIAANLAAALARTGSETVLVSANLPDARADTRGGGALAARLLGVRLTHCLSDVIAGRADMAQAARNVPVNPRLRVVVAGRPTGTVGLLQSQALREALESLRQQADYVVIEAPSTSSSADAQSLAGLADIALIGVELRETTYGQVADAAAQLRRVGAKVLGAVLLPRPTSGDGVCEIDDDELPQPAPVAVNRPRGALPSAPSPQVPRPNGPGTHGPGTHGPGTHGPGTHGPGTHNGRTHNRQRPGDDSPTIVIDREDLDALLDRAEDGGHPAPAGRPTRSGARPERLDLPERSERPRLFEPLDLPARPELFERLDLPERPSREAAGREPVLQPIRDNGREPVLQPVRDNGRELGRSWRPPPQDPLNGNGTANANANGNGPGRYPQGEPWLGPEPSRNGGPGRADRPSARDTSATAMLTALTEDGPLDGVR